MSSNSVSLHDALPIWQRLELVGEDILAERSRERLEAAGLDVAAVEAGHAAPVLREQQQDRKSTRLNSSHVKISYAVFCLKKKKTKKAQVRNANRHKST